MTQIIAFANQKGGVGKTTSAVNIAAATASLGYRVLVCDSDPQGNASSALGADKRPSAKTTYDLLLGADAAEIVAPTKFANLSVMPSNISLAAADIELADVQSRESCLKNGLAPLVLSGDYDFIFIDCPPSLGLITVNILTASDYVIIPMQCEYFSLEGLSQLMVSIKKCKSMYNRSLGILGILVTMYNGRLNLSGEVMGELKRYYPDKLFKTTITRSVKLSEAPSFGTPIYYFDKYSRGSLDYTAVTKEMLSRLGMKY